MGINYCLLSVYLSLLFPCKAWLLHKACPLLYTCIFFIGFGGGIINGGTNALVADISAENKGANLSLLGVSYGIGAFGMPLLLGVLSKHFPYTNILSAVGIFMLLPVIYFLFISFPLPKQGRDFH